MKTRAEDPIDGLVGRFGLPAGAGEPLCTLLEALVTDPRAPTAITERARALDDHLADSLVALELAPVRAASAIADLGSGAGLPALPLAIALPAARVTAVESNARKAEFITQTAAACGLRNVEVAVARAEEWADGRAACDLATARALAPLAVVAEYAAPLLRLGGMLVVWRGQRDLAEEEAAATAARVLGLEIQPPVRVEPYARAAHRHLHPMIKVAETPARFPRRPGMARKRPLGAASARSV
ncbi:MAG TPA: 16S rRNA (guanine(527)-N(7))-methyltransferase RsmG [Solirubrobacteraceae bacterium]